LPLRNGANEPRAAVTGSHKTVGRIGFICVLCLGAGCGQPEPQTHGSFNGRQLSTAELSQRPNQLGVRNGDEILRIEHAHAQEGDGHSRLESGLAWTRGVRVSDYVKLPPL